MGMERFLTNLGTRTGQGVNLEKQLNQAFVNGQKKIMANRAARSVNPDVPALGESNFIKNNRVVSPNADYTYISEPVIKGSPAKHITEVEDPAVANEPWAANLVTNLGGTPGFPADRLWRNFYNQAFVQNPYANEY